VVVPQGVQVQVLLTAPFFSLYSSFLPVLLAQSFWAGSGAPLPFISSITVSEKPGIRLKFFQLLLGLR
jgi:hypothetical protein